MAEITRRAASLGDIKEVWNLVREVASDTAFEVESAASQESMLSEIMACCTSGLSPIAVAADKSVVAALLVRRDDFEWGFRNSPAVHVSHAAVAVPLRDQGMLESLVMDVQARKAPVFVSVKKGEKLGLSDALQKHGFEHEVAAESGWGDVYLWRPKADA